MLRLLSRSFKNKAPLLELSHRHTLPKTKSATGRPNREDRLYDEDKLNKLQSLVKKNIQTSGISLSDHVKKLAKSDKEFNEFLKQYKTKDEPEYSNYLESPTSMDLKHYIKDKNRSKADRLDELYLLDQFRKKKIADELQTETRKMSLGTEFNEEEVDPNSNDHSCDSYLTKEQLKTLEMGERIYFDETNFNSMIIDAGSSTNITKLARVNKRYVLLYMASTDGIISYARGVGINYQDALEDALYMLKRNLICINLDHFLSVPGYLEGHYYNTKVEIFSCKSGKGFWGDPLYYNLLAFAGLTKFQMRIYCRNVNYHTILYCFFQCLINNETPRMISEKTGRKFYEITYGRAWRNDFKPINEDVE